jgi:polysaccharide deacetylase family sporulation protein PdaB
MFIKTAFIVMCFFALLCLAINLNGTKETIKYNTASNDSEISTANDSVVIRHGSRERKELALTFDDGPDPTETNKILDILKKYNVKATFFVIGKNIELDSASVKRASDEGHEIGNHTYDHSDISKLSDKQIKEQILKCEELIVSVTGKKPSIFRPPYGSYNKGNISKIAEENGYKIVLWGGVDALDWKNPPAQEISNSIINNVINGDIILLHDYKTENTLKALDTIIPQLLEKGYKFKTISELLED